VANVSVWLAFGAGVLSFVSPCCLPLYPSYLSYITGVSAAQLKEEKRPRKIQKLAFWHTLFFLLGFSLIFYALGFTFSWAGNLFKEYRDLIRMLGGVLTVAMGLFMLGLFQPTFLMREHKWQFSKQGVSYLGSLLVGIGFAAGWTPCIGPILTSVLLMAAVQPERALADLTAYVLGFAVPFFVMAFFVGRTRWILKYSAPVMKVGGALMVLFGILLYTDQMTLLIRWMTQWTGGFTGF
jgi:cytochrome c-type biogenesis protein